MINIDRKNFPNLNSIKLNYLISEKGQEWVKSEMENMRNTIQDERILSLVPQNQGVEFIYDLFKVTLLDEYPEQIRFEVTLNYTRIEFYWYQYVRNSTFPQDAKLLIRKTSPNRDFEVGEYFVDVTENGQFFWLNAKGKTTAQTEILINHLIIK